MVKYLEKKVIDNDEKIKHYAGLLVLLDHEKMLSMSLYMNFKRSIIKGCNATSSEVEAAIDYAKSNLNFDVSVVYWEFK